MTNPQLPPVFARALNDFEAVLGASARSISATGQDAAVSYQDSGENAGPARIAEPDVVKKEEEHER